MSSLESVFLFLDYLTDTQRKRHIVGGLLMSVSLFFGGLASNAVMEYKIEELTREVRKHNGFAEKIPVIQRDIQVLNHRMTDIETHEHERS